MAVITFNSKVFTVPGLYNSGESHWQTHWEKLYGFERIQQNDWETPVCSDWIATIDATLEKVVGSEDIENVILIGHSLACCTIAYWAAQYKRTIKGALLVAPSDTEGANYPKCTTGFIPMCLEKLPFPTIVISSSDDEYVSPNRAQYFTSKWRGSLVMLENLGHINSASNLGEWNFGIEILKRLDV